MNAALVQQMRREILASLRVEGGQAQWQALTVWEHELLQQMEYEGLIERVQETERSTRFTYRIRSQEEKAAS